eukprot:gene7801-996_t
MTSKPVRKSSLLMHFRECFFGFADSAKEEHFTRLQVEYMKYPIILFAVALSAAGITKVVQTEQYHQNMLWSILLEPTSPLPNLCLMSALLFGCWRFAEPMAIISGLWRFPSLMMWMMCDQALVPAVVQRWERVVTSSDKWFYYAVFLALGNRVMHVRFKFHFMLALAWILVAPTMVGRSPADISAWPLVVILVISVLLRLHSELTARSQFLNHYYPAASSNEAVTNAPVEDSSGGPSVTIMPTPASAEPYNKNEAHHQPQGGHPPAQTRSMRSASPVEHNQGASTSDALASNQAGTAATPRGQQPRRLHDGSCLEVDK